MAFGMWWLNRASAAARAAGEGYGEVPDATPVVDEKIREHATAVSTFDPAEMKHGQSCRSTPSFFLAVLPLTVVIVVNFLMSLVLLPLLDFSFLTKEAWGGTTINAVTGIWSVAVALLAGSAMVIAVNYSRFPSVRQSLDSGANSSVLPVLTVGSLVGFGAVVAALPAFATVRDAVLSIQGGPLISLTVAMNVLAGMTGSASGGMVIALDALGETYMKLAAEHGINPELLHRVSTLGSGTLDSLPHNGTVLTVLQVSKLTHRESYFDMLMTVVAGVILALIAVIVLGSVFGSF